MKNSHLAKTQPDLTDDLLEKPLSACLPSQNIINLSDVSERPTDKYPHFDAHQNIWDRIARECEKLCGKNEYYNWISKLEQIPAEKNDILRLKAPNRFVLDWINQYYCEIISNIASNLGINTVEICLEQKSPKTKKISANNEKGGLGDYLKTADPQGRIHRENIDRENIHSEFALNELQGSIYTPQSTRKSQRTLFSNIGDEEVRRVLSELNMSSQNDKFRFDNFIVAEENRMSAGIMQTIANKISIGCNNTLFLWSDVGMGKTHLLGACAHQMIQHNMNVLNTSCIVFSNQYAKSSKNRNLFAFDQAFEELDALLLDDMQFLQDKIKTQEKLLHIIRSMQDRGKIVVLTGDATPSSMSFLSSNLRNRLNSSFVTSINKPSFNTRLEILKLKAKERNVEFSDQVFELIANQVDGSVRLLEGALGRIIAYQGIMGTSPSLTDIAHLIADLSNQQKKRSTKPQIAEIINVVAEFYGIKLELLLTKRLDRRLSMIRHIAMYLCKELTEASLVNIGKSFNRDHTTVIHACKRISELPSNSDFLTDIKKLRSLC